MIAGPSNPRSASLIVGPPADRGTDEAEAHGLTRLRVLIVEDDYFVADRLAKDVEALGSTVVGPFADADDALAHTRDAEGAILDILLRDATSYVVADACAARGVPFVFCSALDRSAIPDRFAGARLFTKPCRAGLLLDALGQQARAAERPDVKDVIPLLRLHARQLVSDRVAADRLVEAALKAAIAEADAGARPDDVHNWLLDLLARSFSRRGSGLLN